MVLVLHCRMKPKNCLTCGDAFDNNKAFYAHIRKCGKPQGKYQCPYCTSTNTRKDDLIRRHIVDKHPERVADVRRDLTLINFVPSSDVMKAPFTDADEEFVSKLDQKLGLYIPNSFEERQELENLNLKKKKEGCLPQGSRGSPNGSKLATPTGINKK